LKIDVWRINAEKMVFENGILVISLDFELAWGVHDTRNMREYGENILGVRNALPRMLELFEKYQVAATWASVGLLFARNKEEILAFMPEKLPLYQNPIRSPFRPDYFDAVGTDEKNDPYHFGFSLLEKIAQTPRQEIASHTFSHFYCLEPHENSDAFEADLKAAAAIAKDKNIDLKSIVFPRNQFTLRSLAVLKKFGYTHYRGTELSRFYLPVSREQEKIWLRAVRLADAHLNFTGHHVYTAEKIAEISRVKKNAKDNLLLNIPASRFLRPQVGFMKNFNALHLGRIKGSLREAAQNKAIFHLWWHPHNFGKETEANLKNLEKILQEFARMREKFGMTSKKMGEINFQLTIEN
jgi:peptidoglycan/xylan/chitin deacetylase (PgdA/CDA1 family)